MIQWNPETTQDSWFKDTQTIEGLKTKVETGMNLYQISLDECIKKDKIIDLMAETIYNCTINFYSIVQVKQYFEKEASKDD